MEIEAAAIVDGGLTMFGWVRALALVVIAVGVLRCAHALEAIADYLTTGGQP